MRKRSITIQDVAHEAGVSVGTASRVINEKGYFSKEAQTRVLSAAKRLDYKVHAIARNLKQNRSNTIGLIITDIGNPFYATLASGVLNSARESGHRIIVSPTGEDPQAEREYIEMLMEERAAGIVAVPTGENIKYWQDAISMGVTTVFVDRQVSPDLGANVVLVDNEFGAYEATRYLIELGHERIGLINGPISLTTGHDRLAGYRRAHAEAGLPVDEELLEMVTFKGESGYDATKRLLSRKNPPTAIFAANNVLGEAVLFVLKELRREVPEDISLVIFDDVPWTRLTKPALTVVKQPTFEMGRQAMDILSAKLASEEVVVQGDGQTRVMATELIVRGSCSRPRD